MFFFCKKKAAPTRVRTMDLLLTRQMPCRLAIRAFYNGVNFVLCIEPVLRDVQAGYLPLVICSPELQTCSFIIIMYVASIRAGRYARTAGEDETGLF